jgi:hypothetical protein
MAPVSSIAATVALADTASGAADIALRILSSSVDGGVTGPVFGASAAGVADGVGVDVPELGVSAHATRPMMKQPDKQVRTTLFDMKDLRWAVEADSIADFRALFQFVRTQICAE